MPRTILTLRVRSRYKKDVGSPTSLKIAAGFIGAGIVT